MISAIVFALILGWMLWKFYPILKKRGGFKLLMQPAPLEDNEPGGQAPTKLPEEKK